ncbi:ASPM [Symbiodinium sp. CCMP2592]|nr:ASPM [Symbiodinium sp. CCMP2592]
MDWQLHERLTSLDSELTSLLRRDVSAGSRRAPASAACAACPARLRRRHCVAAALASLGARSFNWSAGLSVLRRRDLAELVLRSCRPPGQWEQSLESLCGSLEAIPWTTRQAASATVAAPLPLRPPSEEVAPDGCDGCATLTMQVQATAEALLLLGSGLVTWARDLSNEQQRDLCSLVLDCCRPAAFAEGIEAFLAGLERRRWTELSAFPAPSAALDLLPAAQEPSEQSLAEKQRLKAELQKEVRREEEKVLAQLRSLRARPPLAEDASLRQLEVLLVDSLRDDISEPPRHQQDEGRQSILATSASAQPLALPEASAAVQLEAEYLPGLELDEVSPDSVRTEEEDTQSFASESRPCVDDASREREEAATRIQAKGTGVNTARPDAISQAPDLSSVPEAAVATTLASAFRGRQARRGFAALRRRREEAPGGAEGGAIPGKRGARLFRFGA